jgi:serine/threonine protein kinase
VILERETGRAIVLDFGISAVLTPTAAPISGRFTSARLTGGHSMVDHTIQSGLTSEGMVIGTPYYMSPEQAAMEPVTPKSDVYSLGVLAFELVTGGLPFVEPTPAAMAAAHLNQQPKPVEELRHDLDPEFSALIDQCLKKLPVERPSAEAIARALMPGAAVQVEWPPPGLERLTGRGWRALLRCGIAEGLSLAAHFGDGRLKPHAVAAGLTGAIIRDPVQDSAVWREYLETVMKERDGGWRELYRACREEAE